MTKPMTLKQAVAKVCKRMKRHEWFMLAQSIRTESGDCPLTCGTLFSPFSFIQAARRSHISAQFAQAISEAADNDPGHVPWLRRALLKAAGLPDDTTKKPAKVKKGKGK